MNYYSFNQYLKDTFGQKVYKICLNGGFTCPNRDGTLGTGGCIFCSSGGSGDFAESPSKTVTQQIEDGKKRVGRKMKNGKYIAYFQAFTNTYAPVEKLQRLFCEAIRYPDVAALSIATRPDCLEQDILKLLSELNQIKPVFVELGLQTVHEKSAAYIRRGFPLSVYDRAVKNLHEIGMNVVTHVIIGLPGESREQMLQTVQYVADSKSDGIKLQLLHVLRGTDLARDYENGLFDVLSMEEYLDILEECISILPENMVIHRLTGDGAKKDLIAPLWSADKKKVLNAIRNK